MRNRILSSESGQTVTEYVLGIAFISVGLALLFIFLGDSTIGIFDNIRRVVELPYP